MTKKKLYKVEKGKKIFGVCGGLAEYLDVDPTIVRIIFALICVWKGVGIVAYIVAALILPEKTEVDSDIIDGESHTYYE